MHTILVVDDDDRLLSLITELLRTSGFHAVGASSANKARVLLNESHFDAIIIDWMMPNESGIDLINSIRRDISHISKIPAIMLTAVDDIDRKIQGFEAGVDDYITKPFEGRELIVRLRALIKRTVPEDQNHIMKFGDCEFDLRTDKLTRNNNIVYLSTTELSLLKTLCQRPNKPFSRVELAKKLAFQVSDRTIDVQITRLRKKIGDNPKAPAIIKTVRYIGYALYTTSSSAKKSQEQ